MKILIVGAGGYVSSTVLPALSRIGRLYIGSKSHISALNLTEQYSCEFFDLNYLERQKFDAYFLAIPTHEFAEYLALIPSHSKVWLEKPLTELTSSAINSLEKLIKEKKLDVHCGLLKRNILGEISLNIESFKYVCNVPRQSNWKSLLYLGANWVDGVHAIDLGYLINNESFEDIRIKLEDEYITLKNSKIDITIGPTGVDFLECDGCDYSKYLSYKYSQNFLRAQFNVFINNYGNSESVFDMHKKFLYKLASLK
jgi:hypothetical protein